MGTAVELYEPLRTQSPEPCPIINENSCARVQGAPIGRSAAPLLDNFVASADRLVRRKSEGSGRKPLQQISRGQLSIGNDSHLLSGFNTFPETTPSILCRGYHGLTSSKKGRLLVARGRRGRPRGFGRGLRAASAERGADTRWGHSTRSRDIATPSFASRGWGQREGRGVEGANIAERERKVEDAVAAESCRTRTGILRRKGISDSRCRGGRGAATDGDLPILPTGTTPVAASPVRALWEGGVGGSPPSTFLGDIRGDVACGLYHVTLQHVDRALRFSFGQGRHAHCADKAYARRAALVQRRCPRVHCGARCTNQGALEAAIEAVPAL